jgi:hypothetical protein
MLGLACGSLLGLPNEFGRSPPAEPVMDIDPAELPASMGRRPGAGRGAIPERCFVGRVRRRRLRQALTAAGHAEQSRMGLQTQVLELQARGWRPWPLHGRSGRTPTARPPA